MNGGFRRDNMIEVKIVEIGTKAGFSMSKIGTLINAEPMPIELWQIAPMVTMKYAITI